MPPTKSLHLATAAAFLLLFGCEQTSRPVSQPEIKPDNPESYLVSLESVHRQGERIGYLKTYRFRDRDGEVVRVVDARHDSVGLRDAEGLWWRHSAHEGRKLVGHSDSRRSNVAAVFDVPSSEIKISLEEKLP